MNWLFLRGSVPSDRDPKEIMWNSIDESTDMWEHLFYAIAQHEYAECVYNDNKDNTRHKIYPSKFNVVWYRNAVEIIKNLDYESSILFCRGGFPWQDDIAKMNFNKKIYYGAGRRYKPIEDIYDIVLCDTEDQAKEIGPKARLWTKPASPIFTPNPDAQKYYDVCFIGNWSQPFKGQQWVYETAPRDLKILHLGNNPKGVIPPDNITNIRVTHDQMPYHIRRCKVGIVPYFEGIDSAPRAAIEMAACGLDIVMADNLV